MSTPEQQLHNLLGHAVTHPITIAGCVMQWHCWPCQSSDRLSPIILLHGGYGSWNHWYLNVLELSQLRDVWTLDLPGLGASGDMLDPPSIRHFSTLLLQSIDRLLGPVQPLAVAGFSFGAMIAGDLAVLMGDRCTGCCLIGAAGFGELHVQVPLLASPEPETPAAEAKEIYRENLKRLMLHRAAAIDNRALYLHAVNLQRARFHSRALSRSNQLAALLPAIRAPLMGIWGARDATAGGDDALESRRQSFLRAQPDSHFYAIADSGHWVMYEAPTEVNQLLRSWGD